MRDISVYVFWGQNAVFSWMYLGGGFVMGAYIRFVEPYVVCAMAFSRVLSIDYGLADRYMPCLDGVLFGVVYDVMGFLFCIFSKYDSL